MTNEYYPVNAGGIGMLVEQAVAELSTHDAMEVTVILIGDPGFTEGVRHYGAEHYPNVCFVGLQDMLHELAPTDPLPEWAFTFHNYYVSYVVAEYLSQVDANRPFDVIEFPDYKGFGYVTLKHRRLRGEFGKTHFVVRIHGVTSIWNEIDGVDIHSRERLQLYMMERYSLTVSDSWTLPSRALADQYAEKLGVSYHKLNIVTPIFKKLGNPVSYWQNREETSVKRVLFYGKQQHVKGLDLFIEAAVALLKASEEKGGDRYEFLIIGQDTPSQWGAKGSYGDTVRKMIPDAYKDQIRFLGRIDMATLPEVVKGCSCAVIPSRVETFCLAAHELNWLGVPLVINRIPAFVEYFEDKKSCLYFDGTSGDLQEKIRKIVEDSAVRERLKEGNNAQSIAAQSVTTNRDIYQKLVQASEVSAVASTKTEQPLVSIVVPYYNDMRRYVEETLASIEALEYPNKEIILINDGSTDPAANRKFEELRQQFAGRENYTFIVKENGGLGSARNEGIVRSKGKYILPLDSDDLVEPAFLTETVRALELQPELDAVSTYVSFFRDGSDPKHRIDYVIPYDLDDLLIFAENRAGVACSLFRREVFDRFHYSEDLPAFEDWDFWMQLAEAGRKVEVIPVLLYRYRRREGSMVSSEGFARKAQLMHFIGSRHKEHLRKVGDSVFKMYNQLLWESKQVDENTFPHCKLYFAPNGQFDEFNSIFHRYEMEQPVELEVRLPEIKVPTILRFDPAAKPSSIHVTSMSLRRVNSNEDLWQADINNGFAPVQVAGTARVIPHPECLLISSDGDDPQICCPDLEPSEIGYVLKVSFQVFDRYESILYDLTGKGYKDV